MTGSILSTPELEWVILVPDHPNSLEKRLAARQDHLAGLAKSVDAGTWVMGGPTLEKPPVGDEPRAFNGSFLVAQAATKEEALEELKKDVYAQRGVWDLDKVQIYPWSRRLIPGLGTAVYHRQQEDVDLEV
ncbi:hypothetical protein VTN00DRAFT_694 [Thermoascus crustaceus]|uniref:uncharacterized protein n=1 Tax=Thermoascus crustaceus TaxID=5088 RepID=UPI0037431111